MEGLEYHGCEPYEALHMRLFNPFNDGDDALSIATIAAKLLSLSE